MSDSVLLTFPLGPRLRSRLDAICTLHGPFGSEAAGAIPESARDARVLIVAGGQPTDTALMDALPRLGMIACFGTGFEGVDLAAARARGILVTHAKDSNATSVAEFAMGLVLAAAREIGKGERSLRAGSWRDGIGMVGGLAGRRMGIYGLGTIGRKIASRAEAFEMEIGYHGRGPKPGIAYAYHPTLKGLAEWCDVLVVAVRAGAGTRHAVNRDILAALGRHGVLVNIARGIAVDEAALAEALGTGVIAAAGLDVFENEPEVPAALLALPNAVLTPHMAAFSLLAQRAQARMLVDSLEAFFAGRQPANLVAG